MLRRASILACLCATLMPAGVGGQSRQTVGITLKETAGIRRSAYPVNARVPLRAGALHEASHARLMINGAEAPVQLTVESAWPDGSVQWLDVDFNASLGAGWYEWERSGFLDFFNRLPGFNVAMDRSVWCSSQF